MSGEGQRSLSGSALEERYKACSDATTARHVQAIWLLAQGHEALDDVAHHDGGAARLGPDPYLSAAGRLRARRRSAIRRGS